MAVGRFGDGIKLSSKGDILTRNSSGNYTLGLGSDGQILTAVSSAEPGLAWTTLSMSPTEYAVRIASATATAATASIEFTNISSGYRHLMITGSARGNTSTAIWATDLRVQLNSLTTGYVTQDTRYNGAWTTAQNTNNSYIVAPECIITPGSSSQFFSPLNILMINYASNTTDYKGVIIRQSGGYASELNSTYFHGYGTGYSASTAIVSSIKLTLATGSFDTNSFFQLYGFL